MKRDFETANEGAPTPHKVTTGRVSLSEVVRAVHEQEASAETGRSESLSARYLGMKSKRANVKTMFSTLFREVDGLQFLRNSLEKVLDATKSRGTPLYLTHSGRLEALPQCEIAAQLRDHLSCFSINNVCLSGSRQD